MADEEKFTDLPPALRSKVLREIRKAQQAVKEAERVRAELEVARVKAEAASAAYRDAADRGELLGADLAKRSEVGIRAGRIPVRLGNLLGPEGNIFNVAGALRSALKWALDQHLPISQGAIDTAKDYRQRSYDETLDRILVYYEDIEDSIARLRDPAVAKERLDQIPPQFGDNPMGGFFG